VSSAGAITVVTFNAAHVVFGAGASAETGEHLRQLGVTRALVVCDRFVTASGLGERLEESLRAAGVEPVLYDHIVGEPSEASVQEAVEAARDGFDGFVGVGGGSALDTAKLCALFATHEGDLLDYVNAPIGAGRAVPGPVLPIVALPTTSGTGSEVTTVAIVDFPRLGTKTGISHRYLRPSLAIVDPALTVSCPPGVTASTGIDALMHALEAYTVSSYETRPHLPLGERPPYQGANPFSDPLCERAIELVGRSLRTAVSDGNDMGARTAMALASTIAGIAFSGAGVHIPHALAYPIASLQHEWRPPGYGGAALVPHGFAVAVTAPAVFRFVADAVPERCSAAARLLDGGDDLAASLERLMADVGAPTRLGEIGYGEAELAALVAGALDQRRLLVGSPREVTATELEDLLRASL
jgi:hydroxyacid-oxoacid transhydrogenase